MDQPELADQHPSGGSGGFRIKGQIALFLVFLAIFVLSPVRQVSDAAYSLLVSECLIRHGSFGVERHVSPPLDRNAHPASVNGQLPYHLTQKGEHIYYVFPPGTSILSVPLVALSRPFGMSAVFPQGGYHYREERRMQFRFAALLMAGFALVTYRIANTVLGHRWGLVFTAAVALTTQVWSTASRGLWSHDWAVLLVLIAVLHLLRHETRSTRLRPCLLATVLFWAFLTRPTMAVGIVAVGLYLGLRQRKGWMAYAATVTGWLVAFVAVSWWQYGRLLPPYYLPSRLGRSDFLAGLAGTLVSPSRGLLIFLPHLIAIAYLLIRYQRRSALTPLAILGGCAAVGHLLVVASFPMWWGGDCYGPRLMTDALPWLIIPALVAIDGWMLAHTGSRAGRVRFRIEVVAVVVLSLAALIINGSGALSEKTNEWNWTATAEDYPARLWDWKDAQFLAPFRDQGD